MKLAFLTEHPLGGYTIAAPISQTSPSRLYYKWFPSLPAGLPALRRYNAKIRRELKHSTLAAPATSASASPTCSPG